MADYRRAHARILGWEGLGWSTDRFDVGNYWPDNSRPENFIGTYNGVSALWLGNKLRRRPTAADFYKEGAELYKANYWNPLKADAIKSQALAEALVDWAFVGQPGPVPGQPYITPVFLQSLGLTEGGSPSPSKINAYPEQKLLDMIAAVRWETYRNYAGTFWKHGLGWEYRIAGHTRPDLTRATVPQNLVDHWRNIWYKGKPPAIPPNVINPNPTRPQPQEPGIGFGWAPLLTLGVVGYFGWKYRRWLWS